MKLLKIPLALLISKKKKDFKRHNNKTRSFLGLLLFFCYWHEAFLILTIQVLFFSLVKKPLLKSDNWPFHRRHYTSICQVLQLRQLQSSEKPQRPSYDAYLSSLTSICDGKCDHRDQTSALENENEGREQYGREHYFSKKNNYYWPTSKKQLRQVISKVISQQFSCQFIQMPITFSAWRWKYSTEKLITALNSLVP